MPHQQGRGRARARGARREGGAATTHGTTARTTARGGEGDRGAQERLPKRGSTTHHSITTHTAPPRTHINTQTRHRHHTHQAHPHPAVRPTDGRHTHTHTPTPTASCKTSRRRALAACPTGGQQGEGERLTAGAPSQQRGAPPPWGRPSPTATARNAGSQERTLCSWCWVPTPTPPAPGKHGKRGLAARPQGQAARGGKAPDTRHPSQR